jgi:hypothetical protein
MLMVKHYLVQPSGKFVKISSLVPWPCDIWSMLTQTCLIVYWGLCVNRVTHSVREGLIFTDHDGTWTQIAVWSTRGWIW